MVSDFQDVLSLIRNIAYQANCQVDIVDGVVYLTYLPRRPASVDTITESDVDAERGVEVELTATEELVTKMTINWSTLPIVRDEHVSGKVWAGAAYVDKHHSGDWTRPPLSTSSTAWFYETTLPPTGRSPKPSTTTSSRTRRPSSTAPLSG